MAEINQAGGTRTLHWSSVSSKACVVLRSLNAVLSRLSGVPADNHIATDLISSAEARAAAAGVEQSGGSELFTTRTHFQRAWPLLTLAGARALG